jgi:hypothetical protein
MNFSNFTRRIAATLLAGLAAAAVAAPAQADPPQLAQAPTEHQRATRPSDYASPTATAVRPDDRAGRISPTAVPALPATAADGFDWTDAGIGAGAFTLFLVGVGASVVGLRSRRATALSS